MIILQQCNPQLFNTLMRLMGDIDEDGQISAHATRFN